MSELLREEEFLKWWDGLNKDGLCTHCEIMARMAWGKAALVSGAPAYSWKAGLPPAPEGTKP